MARNKNRKRLMTLKKRSLIFQWNWEIEHFQLTRLQFKSKPFINDILGMHEESTHRIATATLNEKPHLELSDHDIYNTRRTGTVTTTTPRSAIVVWQNLTEILIWQNP